MVSHDHLNGWGIESTHFHGPNMAIYKIADYRDDGKIGGRRGVVISPGGGGTRITGGMPNHL